MAAPTSEFKWIPVDVAPSDNIYIYCHDLPHSLSSLFTPSELSILQPNQEMITQVKKYPPTNQLCRVI